MKTTETAGGTVRILHGLMTIGKVVEREYGWKPLEQ